jgi:predicted Zn finger-like uncharacterized protein
VIVACPSCQTRFQLDPAKLQPVGRHVRCAKCANRWLQLPEGMEPPAAFFGPDTTEPAAPAPESAEPVGPPNPEPALPEPPVDGETQPESGPETGPETAPVKPPETPAEMAESLAAIAEQVAAAGQPAAPGEQPATARAGEASGPANRLGMRMSGPIIVPPHMKPARPARRSSGLGVLLIVGIVIGALLGVAYIFRDSIARTIPGADALYSLFGLSTDNAAADLEVSIDNAEEQNQGGKTFFSVTATIFNLSDYPVEIPALVIVATDENGVQMEPVRFRLKERVAQPGQNIKFQKSFDNWPNIKSFELRVEEAP